MTAQLCYCHNCKRTINSRGIARHRAMHRDRNESVTIRMSDGQVYRWNYAERIKP